MISKKLFPSDVEVLGSLLNCRSFYLGNVGAIKAVTKPVFTCEMKHKVDCCIRSLSQIGIKLIITEYNKSSVYISLEDRSMYRHKEGELLSTNIVLLDTACNYLSGLSGPELFKKEAFLAPSLKFS
jgi:hypothetical protein